MINHPAIIFSILTILFALAHMPLLSSLCCVIALLNIFNLRAIFKLCSLLIQREIIKMKIRFLSKPVKKVPDNITITYVELDSYYDKLRKHDLYKDMNDATILSKREEEMWEILTRTVKIQYDDSKVEDHFEIKAHVTFQNKNKIIMQIKPKSKFGEKVCRVIMNEAIAAHPEKKYYVEDGD